MPNGILLVAIDDNNNVIGMIAYHKHSNIRCEMKRFYVSPDCRGMKLGEKLIKEIIEHAKKVEYKEMALDMIKPLQTAIYLYNKYGFVDSELYYDNPMNDVIYMKLDL